MKNEGIMDFGKKEFLWTDSLKEPKLFKAAVYLISIREACCDYLWRMERDQNCHISIGQGELRIYNWAVSNLHQVYGYETMPIDGMDETLAENLKPSPRMMLSLCENLLKFIEKNKK